MSPGMKFSTRVVLLAFSIMLGTMVGISARDAEAQQGCPNDACSRVCFMGSCWGECYDDPASGKLCDMQGTDCVVQTCNPT